MKLAQRVIKKLINCQRRRFREPAGAMRILESMGATRNGVWGCLFLGRISWAPSSEQMAFRVVVQANCSKELRGLQ